MKLFLEGKVVLDCSAIVWIFYFLVFISRKHIKLQIIS